MRFFPCAMVLLLCAASAHALDPTLQEARLDLMAADREGAARMYSKWLDAHPDSPAAPIVFNRYFDAEQSLAPLLEKAATFLKTARKGASLSETFARIARLFEIVGMTEEARDAYLSAWTQGAPASTLESAFLLSLEMNDAEAMQSALAAMKGSAGDRLELLTACVALQKGDSGPAMETLTRIADAASDQSVVLKALWLRYRIAERSGDAAARQAAVKLLQDRFPRSPECALALREESGAAPQASGSVTMLALPGSFLMGQPAPSPQPPQPAQGPADGAPKPAPNAGSISSGGPAPAAPAGTDNPGAAAAGADAPGGPAAANPKTLSIQAGSFQMKENADDLISELSKNGFAPTLRTDAAQGKLLYRVFVGRGLSADEARALLDKLHGAGFSGFLMSDQ